MRKKTTTSIQLILITSVLASCNQSAPTTASNTQRVYMRADTTAPYTEVTENYQQQRGGMGGMGTALLWYMAFRHLGGRNGYSNNSLHPNSVVGNNAAKSQAYQTQRGGFGKNATNSSSSSTGS